MFNHSMIQAAAAVISITAAPQNGACMHMLYLQVYKEKFVILQAIGII